MSLDTLEPPTTIADEVVLLWPGAPPEPTACGPGPEQTFRQGVPDGRTTTMLRNVVTPSLTVFRPAGQGQWGRRHRLPRRRLAHPGLGARGNGTGALADRARLHGLPVEVPPDGHPARSGRVHARVGEDTSTAMSGALRQGGAAEVARRHHPRSADEPRRRDRRQQRWPPGAGAGARAGRRMGREAGPHRHDRLLGRRLPDRRRGDGSAAARRWPSPRRSTAGPRAGGRCPPTRRRCSRRWPRTTACCCKEVQGLYLDWSKAGRPAEFHVFARGGHGFGMASKGCRSTAGSTCSAIGWSTAASPSAPPLSSAA